MAYPARDRPRRDRGVPNRTPGGSLDSATGSYPAFALGWYSALYVRTLWARHAHVAVLSWPCPALADASSIWHTTCQSRTARELRRGRRYERTNAKRRPICQSRCRRQIDRRGALTLGAAFRVRIRASALRPRGRSCSTGRCLGSLHPRARRPSRPPGCVRGPAELEFVARTQGYGSIRIRVSRARVRIQPPMSRGTYSPRAWTWRLGGVRPRLLRAGRNIRVLQGRRSARLRTMLAGWHARSSVVDEGLMIVRPAQRCTEGGHLHPLSARASHAHCECMAWGPSS
ncbi:hypothetical protein BD310DRAFT_271217 [Dichomitus squalens]|uniref:Uncharacterized protein n=1 Tax=Dichomitus squalens TaxID=114155 RepID=A0A4Q9Q1Y6_9APHY|nr:hypothetical protein BD310DRAFT_271217 [Dichomitus squalens]